MPTKAQEEFARLKAAEEKQHARDAQKNAAAEAEIAQAQAADREREVARQEALKNNLPAGAEVVSAASLQAAQTAPQVSAQMLHERAAQDEAIAQHNAAVLRGASGPVVDPAPNFDARANTPLTDFTVEQLEAALAARKGQDNKNAARCGNVNKHWTGEGEMKCELAKGHVGAHQAHYERAGVKDQVTNWRDEANTVVPEVTPA